LKESANAGHNIWNCHQPNKIDLDLVNSRWKIYHLR